MSKVERIWQQAYVQPYKQVKQQVWNPLTRSVRQQIGPQARLHILGRVQQQGYRQVECPVAQRLRRQLKEEHV